MYSCVSQSLYAALLQEIKEQGESFADLELVCIQGQPNLPPAQARPVLEKIMVGIGSNALDTPAVLAYSPNVIYFTRVNDEFVMAVVSSIPRNCTQDTEPQDHI